MLSNYGNFRQITFSNCWNDSKSFMDDINGSEIPVRISQKNLKTLYYLLYSKYGNSVIASSDTERFKYSVAALIFQFGPTWEKRDEIQQNLRNLTEEELLTGSKAIYNHSYNPSELPTTNATEELTTINEQNTTKFKKAKIEAYAMLYELLRTDVTGEFLNKFKPLFLQIVIPELPLWYETNLDDDKEGE